MNNITKNLKTLLLTSLLICFTGVSQTASADIGLPDSPLFLGTSVPPNIFLALDDSGSMDWEVTETFFSHPRGSFGLPQLTGLSSGQSPGWGWCYTEPVADQRYGTDGTCQTVPNPIWLTAQGEAAAAIEAKMLWNYNYNGTFYNPTINYEPWEGVDNADVAYTDASTTAARINPYNASVGTQT